MIVLGVVGGVCLVGFYLYIFGELVNFWLEFGVEVVRWGFGVFGCVLVCEGILVFSLY